jgi:hypothetical protein
VTRYKTRLGLRVNRIGEYMKMHGHA